MTSTKCPATMCPLFAQDGSPWTGEKDSPCPQCRPLDGLPGSGCGWWKGFGGKGCDGATAAYEQIEDVKRNGRTLQIGPVRQKRDRRGGRSYDCPRAADCQWQKEAGKHLCPPRQALADGLDPRVCAY